MMPPGAPPFPPNGMPPPGLGPPPGGFGGGLGGGNFPPFPPPSGAMPPFAPKNLAATSLQMDRGSNMDNSREDNVAVRANGDANGADDSTSSYPSSQPVPPTIHPDRLRMMGSGTRS